MQSCQSRKDLRVGKSNSIIATVVAVTICASVALGSMGPLAWLPVFLFDDRCVAHWAVRHFAMFPVADAAGRHISPSGLIGFKR